MSHRRAKALDNTVRILALLRGRKHGVALRTLLDDLQCGRSSLYRYLTRLEQGGLPIRRFLVNGEARVALDDVGGELTAEQLWAIAVARKLLEGLAGTHVVAALDRLVASVPEVQVNSQPPAPHDPAVAGATIEAIRRRRKLKVSYRGLRDDEPRPRVIEPVGLFFAAGAWYATAFDDGAEEAKTFKLARFVDAMVAGVATPRRGLDMDNLYAQSVAVWCGEPVKVAVRLSGDGARLVHEYPLHPTQNVTAETDGTVVVRATVAGLEEVTRWVLRWGGAAQVLAPHALLERVRGELAAAVGRYP